MALRRSHGSPVARSSGPVTPSSSIRSRETMPVPFIRCSQISFWSSSASYWSMREGISARKERHFASHPGGMSSNTPPTWKKRVCRRWPEDISNRSRIRSRSRSPHQSIVIAPMSSAAVASQNRWLAIRFSSRWITLRYCARGGTSSPSSRSTDMQ